MRTKNILTLAELKLLIEAGERFFISKEGGEPLPAPTAEGCSYFPGIPSLRMTAPTFEIEGPADTTTMSLWLEA